MNSSLLAQIEILTHPNTLSNSQTNTITTISRLPNLHISQNCIRLLLATDKMNSRVRKKSLNHCGLQGSLTQTRPSMLLRDPVKKHALSPIARYLWSSFALFPWRGGPATTLGKSPPAWHFPHVSYLTVLLHLRAKPFP